MDDGKFAITAAADDPILPSLTQLGRDAKARGYYVEEDSAGGAVAAVVYCPHMLAASRARPIAQWPSFLTATALWTDRFGMNTRRCVRGHEEPHNRTHQAAVAVYRAVRTILAADVCSRVACREAGPVCEYIRRAFEKEMKRAGVSFEVLIDKTMLFGDARGYEGKQITVTLNCRDYMHPEDRGPSP